MAILSLRSQATCEFSSEEERIWDRSARSLTQVRSADDLAPTIQVIVVDHETLSEEPFLLTCDHEEGPDPVDFPDSVIISHLAPLDGFPPFELGCHAILDPVVRVWCRDHLSRSHRENETFFTSLSEEHVVRPGHVFLVLFKGLVNTEFNLIVKYLELDFHLFDFFLFHEELRFDFIMVVLEVKILRIHPDRLELCTYLVHENFTVLRLLWSAFEDLVLLHEVLLGKCRKGLSTD